MKHDPNSGDIHPLPFSRTRLGKSVHRHIHTYICVSICFHIDRNTCMHTDVYALKYAQNKIQLSDRITKFSLPYSSSANTAPGIPSFI